MRHAAIAIAIEFLVSSAARADPPLPFFALTSNSQRSSVTGDSAYNNGDFTRPETSATLRLQYRTSSAVNSSSQREEEVLQYDTKLDLSENWKFGTQIQLPIDEKSISTIEPPSVENTSGLNDAIFQTGFIDSIDSRWAFGFGQRLVAPTATNSASPGLWQIMPVVGVRYSFLEYGSDTYFVPVIRYAISFGGGSSSRIIREPQIAPTLNIGLADNWFVTLYPSNDIIINFGTPVSGQTGRLFLPLDAAIGRRFSDNVIVSVEGSIPVIKDYPVYKFKSELKITCQF